MKTKELMKDVRTSPKKKMEQKKELGYYVRNNDIKV